MAKKVRITKKYLVSWINGKFKELEINDYVVYEVEQTNYSSNQLEGGAACLFIRFRKINESNDVFKTGVFYCFYKIFDIQDHINNGYELCLKINSSKYGNFYTMNDLELDLKKTNFNNLLPLTNNQ